MAGRFRVTGVQQTLLEKERINRFRLIMHVTHLKAFIHAVIRKDIMSLMWTKSDVCKELTASNIHGLNLQVCHHVNWVSLKTDQKTHSRRRPGCPLSNSSPCNKHLLEKLVSPSVCQWRERAWPIPWDKCSLHPRTSLTPFSPAVNVSTIRLY
jgi:hypothetical protein